MTPAPSRSRLLRGLLAAGVSTALAAGGAWWILARRPHGRELLLVDTTEELRALLAQRVVEGEIPMPGIDALGRALPGMLAEDVDAGVAETFYAALGRPGFEYDPYLLFRRSAHLAPWQDFAEHPDGGWSVRTNDLGMREDRDVRPGRPDLRILVIGDSHTDGACANGESFASRLEDLYGRARPGAVVEALNAGCGAYDPFNYLGALGAFGHLEPHALVVVLYGGNDFQGMAALRRYLFRSGPFQHQPYPRSRLLDGERRSASLLGQELDQVLFFLNNPEEEDPCLTVVCAITAELQRQCVERGVALLAVYLPPPSRVKPEHFLADLSAALAKAGAGPESLEVADRLRDRWLAFLQRRGIAHLDLTPHFRGVAERLYWHSDLHLDLEGHRRAAAALKAALDPLLE